VLPALALGYAHSAHPTMRHHARSGSVAWGVTDVVDPKSASQSVGVSGHTVSGTPQPPQSVRW
jgi:hypothetical protein